MTKQDLPFLPEFFDHYINQTEDLDLDTLLHKYDAAWLRTFAEKLENLGDKVYAKGKWTARDILQHIVDTERIMAYRALRISRNDKTPLPGFEENDFAQNTLAHTRTIADLIAEFDAVRQSSILLFKHMNLEMVTRVGTGSGKPITPLAIGFVLVGHPIHHIKVLEERYFGL